MLRTSAFNNIQKIVNEHLYVPESQYLAKHGATRREIFRLVVELTAT